MLHRFALIVIALGLIACTSLPPPPGVGAGGAGGNVGVGGTGAMGGDGGCSGIAIASTELDEGDEVVGETAVGTVADGADPTDRWSINACGGDHDFLLTWSEMGQNLVLDLVVLDADEQPVDVETTTEEDGRKELLGVNLPAGDQFFVEVQAVNTSGVDSLSYNLTVASD